MYIYIYIFLFILISHSLYPFSLSLSFWSLMLSTFSLFFSVSSSPTFSHQVSSWLWQSVWLGNGGSAHPLSHLCLILCSMSLFHLSQPPRPPRASFFFAPYQHLWRSACRSCSWIDSVKIFPPIRFGFNVGFGCFTVGQSSLWVEVICRLTCIWETIALVSMHFKWFSKVASRVLLAWVQYETQVSKTWVPLADLEVFCHIDLESYRLEFVNSKPKSIGLFSIDKDLEDKRRRIEEQRTSLGAKEEEEEEDKEEEEEGKKNRGPGWARKRRIRSGRKKKRTEEEEEEVRSWNVENGELEF